MLYVMSLFPCLAWNKFLIENLIEVISGNTVGGVILYSYMSCLFSDCIS